MNNLALELGKLTAGGIQRRQSCISRRCSSCSGCWGRSTLDTLSSMNNLALELRASWGGMQRRQSSISRRCRLRAAGAGAGAP